MGNRKKERGTYEEGGKEGEGRKEGEERVGLDWKFDDKRKVTLPGSLKSDTPWQSVWGFSL